MAAEPGERVVFPDASTATHMPFCDGKTLLFCQAGPPVEHTFECGGTIWDSIARDPKLQAHFAGLSRTRTMAFRRWRLCAADWKTRKQIQIVTGLPEGAVECSPSFYHDDEGMHVSFIGGIPSASRMEYRLYQMSGPTLDRLAPASIVDDGPTRTGFVGRRFTCLGRGRVLLMHDKTFDTRFQLQLPFARVMFVNHRADDETSLIITGQEADRSIKTLEYNLTGGQAYLVDGPANAYKPSLWGDQIIAAKRLDGDNEGRELWAGSPLITYAAFKIARVQDWPATVHLSSPGISVQAR